MQIPTAIDHYRIAALIGEGRLGAAYKAFDTRVDRLVALRTVSRERAAGAAEQVALAEFRAAALSIARLHHPNIAIVNGFEADGAVAYLAGELLEGRTLGAYLADHRPSTAQAVSFTFQILGALEYAHIRGVVHGAIGPRTIAVVEGSHLTLGEFWPGGLYGVLGDAPPPDSLAYLAPEQRRGAAADERSDIYATGAMLFHLLAGVPPDDSQAQIRRRLTEIHPLVPGRLAGVVDRAMADRPEDRFAGAPDFAAALNGAAATVARSTVARGAAPPPVNASYDRQRFTAGEFLFREGDSGTAAFIVESGAVRIYRTLPDGKEVALATLGRGEIVGEMALIDNKPRMASAQAVEDCVLVVVPREDFTARLARIDKVTQKLLSTVVRRLRAVGDEVTLLKRFLE